MLGHAFQFDMKEGGAWVLYDNLDWGAALDLLPRIARFQEFDAGKKDTDVDLPALKRQARDAVRVALERGFPAIVWSPMTPEMKAGPTPHPVIWGLIVGYNEANETYTIRHPFVPETFTIRYDAFGHTKASDWFNVRVYDGPSAEDERETHLIALKNGVSYAHGTRYDNDERRARMRGRPQGFSAYEVWRDAFESEDVPLRAAEHHALTIKGRRSLAAAYVCELGGIFPKAAQQLESAADHYDRELAPLEALYDLLHTAQHRKSITPDERAKAQELITKALKTEQEAIAQIEAALGVLGVSTDGLKGESTMGGTKGAGQGENQSDDRMNVAVDVYPALPHAGTTLASCMTPVMQTLGSGDWSMATTQGVMGHAFQFAMKEGGGRVMHDRSDWSESMGTLPRLAESQKFGANKKTAQADRAAAETEARDAVRASLARGIPALVWQPMSVEMEKNGHHAYSWGLIVGYNEAEETYTVRHPFEHGAARPKAEWKAMPASADRLTSHTEPLDTYTVRYDVLGHTDGAQWFNIRVFEKLGSEDERTTHVRALRNAIEYANGVRYSDQNFIQKNGKPTSPYGLAAYELWQSAFESEAIPLEPSRFHSEILTARRLAAAAYMRELVKVLPEAAGPLAAAASHYDSEMESLNPLHELLTTARIRESITAGERAEAGKLIGDAFAEQKAVAQIEAALKILDAS